MRHLNRSLPQVDPSRFAMVPRSDVPRSTFATKSTYKTTLDCDYLIPVFVDEVLPGDVHDGQLTVFARLNNLIFPLMDNMTVETFFFFVPNRILWTNWKKMMGEQVNPADSISYTVPQLVSPVGGFAIMGIADYFGIPTAGQIDPAEQISVQALPFRAYNLIYNEWFRDENLQNSIPVSTGDGPDNNADYVLRKRNKKHDYFTSCLPWPLKGGVDIQLPLGGRAIVLPDAEHTTGGALTPAIWRNTGGTLAPSGGNAQFGAGGGLGTSGSGSAGTGLVYPTNLYADLATTTGATINAVRLAVASQQYLEKNARGGTRYTELLRNHFGVTPEDARLQRPEYIGGGKSHIQTEAIPQTSATSITGSTTPVGSLSGQAVISGQHRFKYHATEHGFIIGLANVTGEVTYQQGIHKMFLRQTRFDYYWPTFAHLGEQAVTTRELYATGVPVTDNFVFGYQERWAEYRYRPSRITGLFKSTSAGNIDEWHLSQQFVGVPGLNTVFITQSTPASRVLAAGLLANNQQILWDSVLDLKLTRPIPTYSVPGLTRF